MFDRGPTLDIIVNGRTTRTAGGKNSLLQTCTGAMRRRWASVLLVLAAILAGFAVWHLLQTPMDVPDTSSPVQSNFLGKVDQEQSVGQSFVPKWDNLDQISVVMATQQTNDHSNVTFTIRENGPTGAILRVVSEPISNLPEGELFLQDPFHSAVLDPQWHKFTFQPIPDSAGQKLYFSIEGKDVPQENRVRVGMMFFNRYPLGKAYVNGGEQNAHVVFRAESEGRAQDYIGILAENVTLNKQGLLANPATLAALGLAYLALLLGLLLATRRVFAT